MFISRCTIATSYTKSAKRQSSPCRSIPPAGLGPIAALLHILDVPEAARRERRRARSRGGGGSRANAAVDAGAGLGREGVVVVEAGGLGEVVGDAEALDVAAADQRARHQHHEHHQHYEVQDCVSDHTSLAQLRLLQRVDWRPDLSAVALLA